MELRPITDPEKVVNEVIRRCAKDGSKAAATKHFVAVENGEEVALLHSYPWTSFPIRRSLSFYTHW
jgi:hypothetical protein